MVTMCGVTRLSVAAAACPHEETVSEFQQRHRLREWLAFRTLFDSIDCLWGELCGFRSQIRYESAIP